jgi:hypothetical protein
MTLGRGFTRDEERLPVIVLSHRLWHGRFASDPAILGKSITLSGRPFTVVGIAPPAFRGLDLILDPQFWVPLGNLEQLAPSIPSRDSRASHWLAVIGRLGPGVSRTQAAAELSTLAQRFAAAYPGNRQRWRLPIRAGRFAPPAGPLHRHHVPRRPERGRAAGSLDRRR